MKILRITMGIWALFLNGFAFSQSGEDCSQNLSLFVESVKVKNYAEAYTPWMAVRQQCPSLNVATFSYGERILKDRIKKAATPAEKSKEAVDLVKLYDEWLQHFPTKKGKNNRGSILSSKAQAMLDNKTADMQVIYNTFNSAFTQDAKSFTNPKHLYNYFKTCYDLYKQDNVKVTMEALFDKYEEMSEKFEEESTNLSRKLDAILKKENSGIALTKRGQKDKRVCNVNSKAIATYLGNLDAIIAKEATCENLIPLYKRNFDANKTDPVWLKRAAGRMDQKECSDDPMFVTLVEALHNLEPSADSAYYLGLLNDKNGNNSEALKYYEESISLQTDNYKKAKILFKIAVKFKNAGRRSQARSYAQKALGYQPSMGRAYLLIANMYADSANSCGETQFEKRAVYWLAADMARKAGQVDASLKSTAQKTVKSYEGRAPSKTDIFTEGNAGKVIKFDCWIGKSVTVPNL